MKTWSEKALARHKTQKIGLAAAALLASMHVVAAQEQREQPHYGSYQNPPPCTSLADCGRKAYGESGTRGRMGLGADPAHPEGPGNVSEPN
jgi:hypothetical protein